ncbi:MAG: glycosyltransferase family 4 protein [Armatimonadota bacterium]
MSDRAAILYICFDPIPSPKGAGTHVTNFVSALAERYDVTLLSLGGAEAAESVYLGARHLPVPLPQDNYLDRALAFREAVWDALQEHRYDLVHFRSMWAALPVAEEKDCQGFRTICEVNAVDSIELKYHYPALRANLSLLEKLRSQERLAFSTADLLITPSEVTRHYLLHRQALEERVQVIPNGVDLELFTPAPESIESTEPLTLLYSGTLAPWQGVEFLLDALRLAVDERPMRLRLLCSGSQKWHKAVHKRIAKHRLEPLIEFLPPAPHADVPRHIRAADICLAPLAPTERNLVQGCNPIKLFEYMACGKPIIAANLPVVREVLTDGETALLYKPSKPRRLADCLLKLAEDAALRRQLGENALRTVRERYSWRQAQEALLICYAGLLGDNNA